MVGSVAIGIDLGTTYSCVGIFQNGKVNIIHNESGPRITPSYVAFNKEERLVGTAAKKQSMSNPENTIFQVKRIIGKRFDDPGVQDDIKLWPFKVCNHSNAIKISVQYKNSTRNYSPEQISSMVLSEMKALAESFLGGGKVVKDAVITVPAHFNDSQRQATIDAGKIAGLNVIGILNEPTAAAIAYGVDKEVKTNCNILIYDLGGGTFDVAILSLSQGKIEVKAVGGNAHLGGADFDNRLLTFFLDIIWHKYQKDLSNNQRALGRLREKCEDVKINLSHREATTIEIDALFDGENFQAPLTRTRFENLCSDLFEQTIDQMETTLKESGLQKEDIQEVILVGGSTRIPRIQELLQEFFNGKKLNKSINPDEVVAYGAALRAATLSGDSSIEELFLVDVMPFSLSVGVGDDRVERIIARNTKLPTRVTEPFTTNYDNQTIVRFSVYEGERDHAEHNNHLGTFRLENIQIAPRGVPNISLTYEVDINGILHAYAIDHTTKSANQITIISAKGRLNEEEIEGMIEERKSLEQDAKERAKLMKARSALELYCSDQIKFTRGITGKEWGGERRLVRQLCLETQSWVDQNDEATKDDYVMKLKEVQLKCKPVIAKMKLT